MEKKNIETKETDNNANLGIGVVSGNALWKTKQKKNFCRNRECPFYDGWNYGCKQNSDAERCAARMFF
jgi:hypothetical protein